MQKVYTLFIFALVPLISFSQCSLPAPTGLKVNNVSNCTANLSWNEVPGAAFYQVEYRVTGASTWSFSNNIVSTSTTITSLISNTPYQFAVASFCPNNSSAGFSGILSKSTKKCSSPANLTATNVTSSSVLLSWTQPCNAGEFTLEYKRITDSKWTAVNGISGNSYQLGALASSTTYSWQVKAICGSTKSMFTLGSNFTTVSGTAPRKNVLFIVLDDARYDMSTLTGAPSWFLTPNINRIANEGVDFKIMIPATSQCSPSRATYYTGLYPHVNGVVKNGSKLSNQFTLVQQILHDNGYYTGFVGKYGQFLGTPKGFDWWATSDGDIYVNPDYTINGKDTLIPGHITDVYPQLAKRFLNSVPAGKSFVLFYFHRAPHDPTIPRPQDTSLYTNEVMPFPSDFQFYTVNYPSYYANIEWNRADSDTVNNLMLRTYQCIKGVDDNVDSLFTWLQAKNWMDSTLIICTSDNGYLIGEHKLDGKVLGLEQSIRVPLFIRYPQWFSPNTVITDEIASNIDIAPTLLDYYNIPDTFGFQGISLRQLANGEAQRKSFLYEYAGDPLIAAFRGVRTLTGMYIKSYCNQTTEEYYDLTNDPQNNTNQIYNSAYSTSISQCRALLDSLRTVYGDTKTPASRNCNIAHSSQKLYDPENDNEQENQLKMAPNLASASFEIYFRNLNQQPATLRIFDCMNQEITTREIGSDDYLDEIDCSSWSTGVYLVRIEQGGVSFLGKLVVQR